MKKHLLFPCVLTAFIGLLSSSTSYAQYCTPAMPAFGWGCDFGDEINNFVLNGENSTSFNDLNTGCSNVNAYDDRTAQPAVDMLEGTTYTATISTSYAGGNYAAIWIDFDDDEEFTTAERVASSPGQVYVATGSGSPLSIDIPPNAPSGNHRMRVMMAYNYTDLGEMNSGADIDPCNTGTYQTNYFEVHDYTVNIIGSNPCAGTPEAGTTEASTTFISCTGDVSLSLADASEESGLSYQWESSTDGINWVAAPGTDAVYEVSDLFITTYYRCQVTCIESEMTAASTPVTVTVDAPLVNLGPDKGLCPDEVYVLDGGNPGATYSWSTGASTQTISVTTPGTYSVTVTDDNDCSISDEVIIGTGDLPEDVMYPTAEICEGAIYTMNAGNEGATYLWNTGATSQTIDATTTGNYTVEITNADGCSINTGTELTVHDMPVINLGQDTTVCDGITLSLDAENEGSSYLWNTGEETQTIEIGTQGTYIVTVTSVHGCIGQDSFSLTILPQPYVEGFNFVPLFYENLGRVLFNPLLPTDVIGYEWDFGDGSPLDFQETPAHTYASNGSYLVTLKVDNFCGSYSTAQMIYVDHVTGIRDTDVTSTQVKLFPNPGTELIQVELEGPARIEQVKVYNLLGAVVYQKELQATGNHQFSVRHWASGVYTISIMTNEGSVQRKFEVIR